MKTRFHLLLFGCLLALGQSEIPCRVTQTSDGTLYSIPNVTASECIYTWSNGTTVVSNNREKNDLVVLNSSINALLTKTCFEEVTYSCNCISEKQLYSVTCTTSCSAASLNSTRPSASAHPGPARGGSSLKANETSRNHIVVPATVSGLIVVVVYFVYRCRATLQR